MKRFLYFLALSLCLFSCSRSLEDRTKDLVENYVKSNLYIPESYDPVDYRIDSMTFDLLSPDMLKNVKKIQKLCLQYENQKRNIDFDSDFYSSYGIGYETQNKINHNKSKLQSISEQLIAELNALAATKKEQREFMGYFVMHKYRAKNNAGTVTFGLLLATMDKDASTIFNAVDSESPEAIALFSVLSSMNDYWDEEITEENLPIVLTEINSYLSPLERRFLEIDD